MAQPDNLQAQGIKSQLIYSNQTSQKHTFSTTSTNSINSNSNLRNSKTKIVFAHNPKTQQRCVAGNTNNKTIILRELEIDSANQKLSLNTRKTFTENTKPNEEIGAIAISADCKYLAASFNAENVKTANEGKDNRIVIWDVETVKIAARLYGPSNINTKNTRAFNYFNYSLIFTKDNQVVAGYRAQENSPVIRWNLNFLLPIKSKKNKNLDLKLLNENTDYSKIDADQGYLESIALSHDNKLLATSGSEKTVKLWDATSWKNTPITDRLNIKESYNGATTLTFSKNNNQLTAGITKNVHKGIATEGEVLVWDIENLKSHNLIRGFPKKYESILASLDFNDQNNLLLAGYADGKIKILQIPEGTEVINKELKPKLKSAFFIPNNEQSDIMHQYAITAQLSGDISLWKIKKIQSTEPINYSRLLWGIILLLYANIALYLIDNHRKKLKIFVPSNRKVSKNYIGAEDENINNFEEELEEIIKHLQDNQQAHKIRLDYQGEEGKSIEPFSIEIEYDNERIIESINNTSKKWKEIKQFHKSLIRFGLILTIYHIILLLLGIWLFFTGFQTILENRVEYDWKERIGLINFW
ncbi:hypothetical protein NWP21_01315 [Anabaenopsis sp. FSS-46]|uniref:WD40 repeat domain-containing protein n=1 Tax=Anabaenopsis sp. FSS-46 TaxID=2971766 RepID=UPI0024759B52|nr:hypothetical protein [Anabaenopsis sp. FSS-46]MDH6097503.1 hypothetical protein [Anabaenopsis sp. FSS-46]